jgi:hypothetical protein
VLREWARLFGDLNGIPHGVTRPPTAACPPTTGAGAGRTACRAAGLRELGQRRRPGARLVGRLAHQKGIDLLLPLIDGWCDGWRLAVLGPVSRP